MNILLISRKNFALHLPLSSGFIQLGHQVTILDPEELVTSISYRINVSAFRLPFVLRSRWEHYFFSNMNKLVLNKYDELKPDLVLVYNHGWLIPETIKVMKRKCKVFFYMVDSPFYTRQSHFLYNLFEGDRIFAIDSAWIEQLKRIGIKNIEFGTAGVDKDTFYPMKPSAEDIVKYSSDIVFMGNCPSTVSGFKRAMFLNQFVGMNFKIHGGPEWKKWFTHFPSLEKHLVLRSGPYTFEKMNVIFNCCKIAPVDANPGVINGIHPKIFDCIASGILPIVEQRKDTEAVFGNVGIPLIYDYKQARELAIHYLNNENERLQKIKVLRDFVLNNYTSVHFARKVLEYANR